MYLPNIQLFVEGLLKMCMYMVILYARAYYVLGFFFGFCIVLFKVFVVYERAINLR